MGGVAFRNAAQSRSRLVLLWNIVLVLRNGHFWRAPFIMVRTRQIGFFDTRRRAAVLKCSAQAAFRCLMTHKLCCTSYFQSAAIEFVAPSFKLKAMTIKQKKEDLILCYACLR